MAEKQAAVVHRPVLSYACPTMMAPRLRGIPVSLLACIAAITPFVSNESGDTPAAVSLWVIGDWFGYGWGWDFGLLCVPYLASIPALVWRLRATVGPASAWWRWLGYGIAVVPGVGMAIVAVAYYFKDLYGGSYWVMFAPSFTVLAAGFLLAIFIRHRAPALSVIVALYTSYMIGPVFWVPRMPDPSVRAIVLPIIAAVAMGVDVTLAFVGRGKAYAASAV